MLQTQDAYGCKEEKEKKGKEREGRKRPEKEKKGDGWYLDVNYSNISASESPVAPDLLGRIHV